MSQKTKNSKPVDHITGEQVGDTVDLKQTHDLEQKQLSIALAATLEAESNFKLYSYRIIPAKQFVAKFEELIEFYQAQTKV